MPENLPYDRAVIRGITEMLRYQIPLLSFESRLFLTAELGRLLETEILEIRRRKREAAKTGMLESGGGNATQVRQ